MFSMIIWFCLLSNFNVIPAPMLNISSNIIVGNSKSHLINRRIEFDINLYRSSWQFVDKHTVRVRFRLYESLINTFPIKHFLVRHLHSGQIRTYDEPSETLNSTLTLYLRNMKHGRHIVCLLLYRTKLMLSPRYVFCQDVVFNFHKYGHQDMDLDEHGNTFVFLLTQYSIVIGFLCILHLIHTARKRRFLRTVYDKANALRTLMTEYNRKSTNDSNQQTHALEYLIYNLNRNALYNIDQMYIQSKNDNDDNDDDCNISPKIDRQTSECERYLKIPSRLSKRSTTSYLRHRRSLNSTNNLEADDEDIFDESDFDTRSYEEQSISFKSVSHILEENKPWITKLNEDGSIKHTILSSEPRLYRV